MQQEFTESPQQRPQSTSSNAPSVPTHHGSLPRDPSDLERVHSASSRSSSPRSVLGNPRRDEGPDGVDAGQLDERLRGLNGRGRDGSHRPRAAPGQRVSDYENALTPRTPRQALGFKVIKRSEPKLDGAQLTDFPNEILTHVLSHLHPDSHASVALISKRFYALVTMPHAWRMAFMRYFPGHTALETGHSAARDDLWTEPKSDRIRSETRYFPRLTQLATWRSEYLFRTRLLRNLARGKPGTSSGGIGASVRSQQSNKKANAVLTYNSKLPWLVTNVHAVFTNGKKPPRAIQGAADLGVATSSDPTTGRIEKWGLEDPFMAAQLEEIMPNMTPYGLAEGPAAVPNVMDVSQPYGMLAGEGHPGGRAFFRGVSEMRGKYLEADMSVADTYPDIPKIPELSEAICSLWIAKSSSVPAVTQSMIGMLTGSTLGVVTAYSLGWDSSGPRYTNGDMTARWILSPGVPIVSLKVDDSYNVKRKSTRRVWAVAMNALGEVFYLTQTPTTSVNRSAGDDLAKNAWYAGRTAYWHLVDNTRRIARPDELDKNAVRGAYSPRSPADFMNLGKEQLVAEAREIEKFLHHRPAHFRKVCEGWDMQRRLEVDFANDDGLDAGESIFVIGCGLAEGRLARVQRFQRSLASEQSKTPVSELAEAKAESPAPSLFGAVGATPTVDAKSPEPQSPWPHPQTPVSPMLAASLLHDWQCSTLKLKNHSQSVISASALDCSTHSQVILAEDPLHIGSHSANLANNSRPDHGQGEIPGRRARLLTVGTKTGAVLVWNAREHEKARGIHPLRVIQTESPEISCLAASALYLVHGGSDGLVQAWDPLASILDPIRTLNARSNGRVPRHMMTMNPTLREGNYSAVGAIHLDPDPTVLRGVVSFGAFLRYWTYSSTSYPTGRKRRLRHSDIHGRLSSRRQGGAVAGYIAAEEAELRRENEQRAREATRLRNRFGLGALGDITEEEAMRYAEMVSEEAYVAEEQRRASDSAADASLDTASSYSETTVDTTVDTEGWSPVSMVAASPCINPVSDDEEGFEQQIQQAIRLSLLEGVNDHGQSPRGSNSGEYEVPIKVKPKRSSSRKGKGSRSGSSSASATHTSPPPPPPLPMDEAPSGPNAGPSSPPVDQDQDLALAIRLSMQEHQQDSSASAAGFCVSDGGEGLEEEEQFPALASEGVSKAKGKGVQRW